MKRITKEDAKRKVELSSKLTICENELEAAIQGYNAAQTEAFKPVAVAVEQYNDLVREAQGFCEDIGGEIESYIDERSDAWREGDKGPLYDEWKDMWQEAVSDCEIEIDEPRELETPDVDAASRLNDLEDEVTA